VPKRKPNPDEAKNQAVEEITGLVDALCKEHLNYEYAELCRRLTEKLGRKRPSPLVSGNSEFVAKKKGEPKPKRGKR
jgi:hypothetical protein